MKNKNKIIFKVTIFSISILLMSYASSKEKMNATNEMIEIRTYNLKPGTRNEFHQLVVTKSLPLLKKWKIKVVAYGPSLHDEDSYYLIRSFKSLEDRQKIEDTFYSSDDWLKGPREEIMALIENYTTIVVAGESFRKWKSIL